MDQRTIYRNFPELFDLLARLQGVRASFILDHEGLTRLDGTITSLTRAEDVRQSELVLDGGPAFRLDQVIAVNGTFRWDYTEC
jgi:hypothetical protein